ncbi:hypothetical protein QP162_08475 [Sphingomonas aurantiaca]|uniref:hypothetical protein n=1 Tax=Sphingomonas aurantiaca TaxID=185949 RepID=UPI002FDF787B
MAAGVWWEAMPVLNFRFAVSLLAVSSFAVLPSAPVHAAVRRSIAVAPGPLDRAIAVLAQQAGVDIGSAEPGLEQARAAGVKACCPHPTRSIGCSRGLAMPRNASAPTASGSFVAALRRAPSGLCRSPSSWWWRRSCRTRSRRRMSS